jgi:virginiamycin B lyase
VLKGLRNAIVVAGVAMLVASVAQAAPIGTLKQFRIPTANGNPAEITQGSDGNFWFTESHVNPPQTESHHVGRITPAGAITEFLVCQFCFPNDIVQGPDGILYFTKSDPGLGRITTSGTVLPDVVPPNTLANGNGVAASGNGIYFAAFNTNSIWRYDAGTGAFTEFPIPTPGAGPFDVAAAADGTIWFTEFHANQIGRLNPATGVITETPLGGGPNGPRGIAVATDGKVWFTKRFDNSVGFLDPATSGVTEFPPAAGAGPEGIAAAPDGSVWFTQSVAGNVARITAAGDVTEGKRVKGSEPFGVTVAPDGNPWYAELSADKIAVLQLR